MKRSPRKRSQSPGLSEAGLKAVDTAGKTVSKVVDLILKLAALSTIALFGIGGYYFFGMEGLFVGIGLGTIITWFTF